LTGSSQKSTGQKERIEARIAYEWQLEEEQREKPREQRKKDTWNLDSSPSLKTNQVKYTNKLTDD